jgi:hypothetical protein
MRRTAAGIGLLFCIAVFSASGLCAGNAASNVTENVTDPAGGSSGEQVEEAAAHAAEQAVEKVAEKVAAEAAAKAEQAAMRPDEWRGPTRVNFLVFIVDVDDIDDAKQNFTANVYIRLRWKDRRLAQPGSPVRQLSLESIWNPRVLIANATGIVPKSLPDIVQVAADGTVTYHQRYTGKFSQPLRLSEFPKDQHSFSVHFVAAGYSADQLEFIPEVLEYDDVMSVV